MPKNHLESILETLKPGATSGAIDFINWSFFTYLIPIKDNPFLNRLVDNTAFNLLSDKYVKHLPPSDFNDSLINNFAYNAIHLATKFITYSEIQAILRDKLPNNLPMFYFGAPIIARSIFFTLGETANMINSDVGKWTFNIATLAATGYFLHTGKFHHGKITAGLIGAWVLNDVIHNYFPDDGLVQGAKLEQIVIELGASHALALLSGKLPEYTDFATYFTKRDVIWYDGVFPHVNKQFDENIDRFLSPLGKFLGFTFGKAIAPYAAIIPGAMIPAIAMAIPYVIEPTAEYAWNKIEEFRDYLGQLEAIAIDHNDL